MTRAAYLLAAVCLALMHASADAFVPFKFPVFPWMKKKAPLLPPPLLPPPILPLLPPPPVPLPPATTVGLCTYLPLSGNVTYVATFAELRDAVEDANTRDVVLTDDIGVPETVTIAGDKRIISHPTKCGDNDGKCKIFVNDPCFVGSALLSTGGIQVVGQGGGGDEPQVVELIKVEVEGKLETTARALVFLSAGDTLKVCGCHFAGKGADDTSSIGAQLACVADNWIAPDSTPFGIVTSSAATLHVLLSTFVHFSPVLPPPPQHFAPSRRSLLAPEPAPSPSPAPPPPSPPPSGAPHAGGADPTPGGAIVFLNSGDLLVKDTTFAHNAAGFGSALTVLTGSPLFFERLIMNYIQAFGAEDVDAAGRGRGMDVELSTVAIARCAFLFNSGGAVLLGSGVQKATVVESVFKANNHESDGTIPFPIAGGLTWCPRCDVETLVPDIYDHDFCVDAAGGGGGRRGRGNRVPIVLNPKLLVLKSLFELNTATISDNLHSFAASDIDTFPGLSSQGGGAIAVDFTSAPTGAYGYGGRSVSICEKSVEAAGGHGGGGGGGRPERYQGTSGTVGIKYNILRDNRAVRGGGLFATVHPGALPLNSGNLFMVDNLFLRNHAEVDHPPTTYLDPRSYGGGVDLSFVGQRLFATVMKNRFVANKAGFLGGAMATDTSLMDGMMVIVESNLFEANIAGLRGGAIASRFTNNTDGGSSMFYNNDELNLLLLANVFALNQAGEPDTSGNALACVIFPESGEFEDVTVQFYDNNAGGLFTFPFADPHIPPILFCPDRLSYSYLADRFGLPLVGGSAPGSIDWVMKAYPMVAAPI